MLARPAVLALAALVALTATSPVAVAQESAPPPRARTAADREADFEAVAGGSMPELDDLSVPLRNPTRAELEQYLRAFRSISLGARMKIDDGRGARRRAKLGAFTIPNGSTVDLRAAFRKRRGERESTIRTLEMIPSQPMALGPLRFNRMTMDEGGVMRLALNVNLMGFDFWPQNLTVERIYRDGEGNLVFKTGGTGLAGAFVPDFRIKPNGVVQRFKRTRILGITFSEKWVDLEDDDDQPMRISGRLPIERWPATATDLLDWLPMPSGERRPGVGGNPFGAVGDAVEAVPVTDMSVQFDAIADPHTIDLSNDQGRVRLSDHRLSLHAAGRFEGRTFRTDPNRDNSFEASATVEGELRDPSLGGATLDRVSVRATGTHGEAIDFDDPDDLVLDVAFALTAGGDLRNLRANLPGGGRLEAREGIEAGANVSGDIRLRPLTGNPEDARELTIDNESVANLTVRGPVQASELGRLRDAGLRFSGDTVTVRPQDDPRTPEDESARPVLDADVRLGTRRGLGGGEPLTFARADIRLGGATDRDGIVDLLNPEDEHGLALESTIAPGARVDVDARVFAGVHRDLIGGGARTSVDARIAGTGRDTTITANGVTAEIDGEADVDARVAANVRVGTANGPELQVRSVAVGAGVELRDGEGRVAAPVGDEGRLDGTIGPGTSFRVHSGRMLRENPRTSVLETPGFSRGERGASVDARLVLTAGSLRHRDLALAFDGRAQVDLGAAIGFRLDPAALIPHDVPVSGAGSLRPASPLASPIETDLDLAISFGAGSTVSLQQGAETNAAVTLGGPTHVRLSAASTVDPGTGNVSIGRLDGIDVAITADHVDLRQILGAAGLRQVTVESPTTARIRNARVELTEGGMRIHHDGITFDIAAGTITIGRPGAGAPPARAETAPVPAGAGAGR